MHTACFSGSRGRLPNPLPHRQIPRMPRCRSPVETALETDAPAGGRHLLSREQTDIKTLPCPKLRLRAEQIRYIQ